MEEYQSIKKVKAKKMDRFEAQELGLVRDILNKNEEGYLVEYSDDYKSWSPKKAFEDGYIKI